MFAQQFENFYKKKILRAVYIRNDREVHKFNLYAYETMFEK